MMFDAMGALSTGYNDQPGAGLARPTTPAATASSSPAAPACWCSRTYAHARARGATHPRPSCSATASAPTAHDMVAPSGEGAVRCMRHGAEHGLRTPLSTTSTPMAPRRRWAMHRRAGIAVRKVFGADAMPPISVHQGAVRAIPWARPACTRRSTRLLMLQRPVATRPAPPTSTSLDAARRILPEGACARAGMRKLTDGAVEQLRFRWHQCHPGVLALRRLISAAGSPR